MKSKILFFSFILTSHIIFGQNSEHLAFKGVPLDGKLDDYLTQMKNYGFEILETEDGVAMLKGDFAGYKHCIVGVSTLKLQDLVYKISVIFPENETWSMLSGNYFDLKEMLTEKYGKPSDVVEKFDVPSYNQPRDDNDKMYRVKFDNCKYYSIWKTDKGEIQLSIDHADASSCFVKLLYHDKINGAIINAHSKDDL